MSRAGPVRGSTASTSGIKQTIPGPLRSGQTLEVVEKRP